MTEWPMIFAHSERAIGLVIWTFLFLGLVLFERRGSDALDRLVGPSLRNRLVDRPSPWRRWSRVTLIGVAGFSMVVALMQPQWGLRFVSTPRVGAEIMIALDVSKSMLADDAKPSRLERAKAEISDLLAYLEDDYVGLIAFAGRASVLSPMTPDKSFLRLALESAGAHSVSRGGTKLAEPIRRAVAGMGEAGPAQRALILITDGEDHDSFALDAARSAAEAGIKIIAIGFGDEAGAEIYVTDPRTGARTQLRDADGRPVVSRLDGDLLREIALATDGAFVPAGTGVLDLASIYEAHIAKLTRGQLDDRGRSIRDEGYQFFVLLALLALFGAVSVSTLGSRRSMPGSLVGLVLLFVLGRAIPADAQVDPRSATTAPMSAEEGVPDAFEEAPRAKFNRANAILESGDSLAASALLRDARREATDDLELRYAATFNLGMAAAARATQREVEDPSEALEALYEAADWFREASAARPDETDPRHNLDVTLRRALVLADRIATQAQAELDAELDAMIEAQRERVATAAALLEEVVRAGELDAADALRSGFDDAATQQRILLSDASALGDRVARKLDGQSAVPEADRTPEAALEAAQLEAVLAHLDSAIDRMGQTRRQFRQRRAERAYRRGSNALGDLKRARDQLRGPVEQIGSLLDEVGRLARSTVAIGMAERASGVADAGDEKTALPAFLTRESVEAESGRLEVRVGELAERFVSAAGLAAGSDSSAATQDEADLAAQRLALQEAAPHVTQAADAMRGVTTSIGAAAYDEALSGEAEVAEALADARERFFDLRQLLNATHADQSAIVEIVESDDPAVVAVRPEHASRLARVQAKNRRRGLRLADLLEREGAERIAQLEAARAEAGGAAPPDDPAQDPIAIEEQRFGLANRMLEAASGAMHETSNALEGPSAERGVEWTKVASPAKAAEEHLDALRTLFFSIAEHVQRLALDQVEVRDQTQDAIALSVTEEPLKARAAGGTTTSGTSAAADSPAAAGADPEPPAPGPTHRGPETTERARGLSIDQSELESRGGQIADALFAQAEQAASALPGDAAAVGAPGAPDAAEERDRIRRAAEHVASAQLAMQEAQAVFASDDAALAPVPEAQAEAIEELGEALRLLSPPPPEGQPEEQGEDQESSDDGSDPNGEEPEPESDESEGSASAAESESQESEEESMDDPSQLLQGVRDRDAERRREREREQRRRRADPVDKDW